MNKGIIVAISVVVIAVAAGIIFSRQGGGGEAPKSARDMQVEMIDKNSNELITKSNSEWQALGTDNTGAFKNPTTNEYSVVPVMPCNHCGEKIPSLLPPPSTGDDDADEALYQQMQKEYKCPQCGKMVFGK